MSDLKIPEDLQELYAENDEGGFIKELIERIARLEAENAQWAKWGVVEIAVRNPSVADYMQHWEGRALKAEAEIEQARAQVARLQGSIDYRLNEHLGGMKPEYDDSITGFNEAWDIVREVFASRTAPAQADGQLQANARFPRCKCGGVAVTNASGDLTRTCIRCGAIVAPTQEKQ